MQLTVRAVLVCVCLAVATWASAAPILITSGSLKVGGGGWDITGEGESGQFHYTSPIVLAINYDPFIECRFFGCQPGSSLSPSAISDSFASNTFITYNGITCLMYPGCGDIGVGFSGPKMTLPDFGPDTITLSEAVRIGGGGIVHGELFGVTDPRFTFSGSGIAELKFSQFTNPDGVQAWHFDNAVYTVTTPTPVPEPATLLLVGTGALGLIATARRRRTRSHAS